MKKTKVSILATIAFLLFSIFLFVTPIFASPPASPYAPGETLNPTCAPGSANCSVSIPEGGLRGDGTFISLTTSTVQFGIGATSSLAKLYVQSTSVGTSTLYLQGLAGQTANLLQAASSSGQILFEILPTGLASSTNLITVNASTTNLDISGYLTVSATSTLGSTTVSRINFTSASGTSFSASSYVNTPTLVVSNASTSNESSTNLSASGYGLFSTLLLQNAAGIGTLSTSTSLAIIKSPSAGTASTTLLIQSLVSQTGNLLTVASGSGQRFFEILAPSGVASSTEFRSNSSTIGTFAATGVTTLATASTTGNVTIGGTFQSNAGQSTFGSVSSTAIGVSGGGYILGNVGIGNTAPGAKLEVSAASPETRLSAWSATASNQPLLTFQKSSSATIGTLAITSAGESLGEIDFSGVDTNSASRIGNKIISLQVGAAGSNFIGSSLAFQTAASSDGTRATRLFIADTGNVGIGTTAPNALLHVAGSSFITGQVGIGNGTSTAPQLYVQSTAVGTSTLYLQGLAGQTANLLDVVSSTAATEFFGVNNSGQVMVGTSTTAASNAILTIASTTNIMTVLSNGRVGIGTTNPGVVNGQAQSGTNLIIKNTGGNARVDIEGSTTGILDIVNTSGAANAKWWSIQSLNGSLQFYSINDDSSVLRSPLTILNSSGNVGIGTTAPNALLHVAGSSFITGQVGIGNGTSTAPQLYVQSTAVGTSTLYLQGLAGQTANLLDVVSSTAATEFFGVNNSGQVFIATTTAYGATSTLTVCARSNCTTPTTASSTNTVAFFASTGGLTTNTSIVARGVITSGLADVGEFVEVAGDESNYQAGDVLRVSQEAQKKFEKSKLAYDPSLAGVVTETAGLVAGGGEDNHGTIVIALAGRVPVKVNGEGGDIKIGDYLTASSAEGVAMKATKLGRVLGIALEPFPAASTPLAAASGSATGTVMTFINVGFSFGSPSDEGRDSTSTPTSTTTVSTSISSTGLLSQFTDAVKTSLEKLGASIYQGVIHIKEIIADKITTRMLCLDDTCVNRDQLKYLLEHNPTSPSLPPSPTSTPSSSLPQADSTLSTSTSAISSAQASSSQIGTTSTTSTPAASPSPTSTIQ